MHGSRRWLPVCLVLLASLAVPAALSVATLRHPVPSRLASAPAAGVLAPERSPASGTGPAAGPATFRPPDATRSDARRIAANALQARLRAGEAADRRASLPGAGLRAAALERSGLLRRSGAVQRIAGVEHSRFVLHKNGLPILNRRGRLHQPQPTAPGAHGADANGPPRKDAARYRELTGRVTFPPFAEASWRLDSTAALAVARRRIGVRGERAAPRVERGAWAMPGGTRPVWRVTIPASRPLGTWQLVVDAEDGSVLAAGNRMVSSHCEPDEGRAMLYPRNPLTTPQLQETCLSDFVGPGDPSFGFLSGRITRVYDVRAVEAFRRDLVFDFSPEDPRFAQTSAYRTLTATGLFAERFGFPAYPRPIVAFTNPPGFEDDPELNNAFYDPFFPLVLLGNGDGTSTAHLGIDSDVAAHEMGHHIFQVLVDPAPGGQFSEIAAMNEAVADTVAALMSGDPDIGESTLPGQPWLRTLDNDRFLPDDGSSSPHEQGLIYGGFNWDLIVEFGADTFSEILIAGLPFLDSGADDPPEWRDALINGDQVVTGGVNVPRIRSHAEFRNLDFLDDLGFRGELDTVGRESDTLADGEFHLWLFREFPPARELRFFLVGGGDADLYIAPLSNLDLFLSSTFENTSNEREDITTTTIPSVEADDIWLVAVEDYPDGNPTSYLLSVQSDLAPADAVIGGSASGSLDLPGELDVVLFDGNAGQIVSLAATPERPELDLVLGVFDFAPDPGVLIGADDDSGPGLAPRIQGARLPATRRYAAIVFSPTADVDPRVGTGGWSLTLDLCNNQGPDFDGDGQVDACDDDDDDDDFTDAIDSDPLDPALCIDIESDGCDDCANRSTQNAAGPPNFLDDGPDLDGDSFCDLGDPDDDNDGCLDEDDRSPRSPSEDPDLDFLGGHCDNCPEDHNPDQRDSDADGLGDLCDPTPTPEPAAFAATVLALAVLGALAARRRSRPAGATP